MYLKVFIGVLIIISALNQNEPAINSVDEFFIPSTIKIMGNLESIYLKTKLNGSAVIIWIYSKAISNVLHTLESNVTKSSYVYLFWTTTNI